MGLWDSLLGLMGRKKRRQAVAGQATVTARAGGWARIVKAVGGRASVSGQARGEAGVISSRPVGAIDARIELP